MTPFFAFIDHAALDPNAARQTTKGTVDGSISEPRII